MKKVERDYTTQLFLVALVLVFALAFFIGTATTGNVVFDYTRADCTNPEAWVERCVIEGGFTRQSCNDLAEQCNAIRASSSSESGDNPIEEESRPFMQQLYNFFVRDDGVEQPTLQQENEESLLEENNKINEFSDTNTFFSIINVPKGALENEKIKEEFDIVMFEVQSSLAKLNALLNEDESYEQEILGDEVDERGSSLETCQDQTAEVVLSIEIEEYHWDALFNPKLGQKALTEKELCGKFIQRTKEKEGEVPSCEGLTCSMESKTCKDFGVSFVELSGYYFEKNEVGDDGPRTTKMISCKYKGTRICSCG